MPRYGVMPDYGAKIADKAFDQTTRKIREVYRKAAVDLQDKLKEFNLRHAAKQKEMLKKLEDGEITKAAYESWMRGQVFIGKQWKEKIDSTVKTISTANRQAASIVQKGRTHVFAENYNYAAYQLEKQSKGVVSFNLYNENAVGKLIKRKPKMLPEWNIDKRKDYAWNRQKVENVVTQGIIQGKGIGEITNDLVDNLCTTNDSKMRTFARTAMTGAQNAGRQARMEDAEEEGVMVKKRWVATLDDRTRDTHADLDGQEVPVDEPFEVDGFEIMYPGDPNADPCMVYNCRCTMIEVYEGIDRKSVRRDEDNELVEDMTYNEWKEWKEGRSK